MKKASLSRQKLSTKWLLQVLSAYRWQSQDLNRIFYHRIFCSSYPGSVTQRLPVLSIWDIRKIGLNWERLTWLLPECMSLGKSLSISVPQSLPSKMGIARSFPCRILNLASCFYSCHPQFILQVVARTIFFKHKCPLLSYIYPPILCTLNRIMTNFYYLQGRTWSSLCCLFNFIIPLPS